MSYSRTVRCSHCYKEGHNKAGCPERKKAALESPDSYDGKMYIAEQERRKRAVANRSCSYCGESDPRHNRRGCTLLKDDRTRVVNRQLEYQRHFGTVAQIAGLSHGALVKVPMGNVRDKHGVWERGYLGLVTGAVWENIDFTLQDTAITRSWQTRDRKIFSLRVASIWGDKNTVDDYYRPYQPKIGQVEHLSVLQVSSFMEKAFQPDLEWGADAQLGVELVGKSHHDLSAPLGAPAITENLNNIFHFSPDKRADKWEKARIPLSYDVWSKVRPEEFIN